MGSEMCIRDRNYCGEKDLQKMLKLQRVFFTEVEKGDFVSKTAGRFSGDGVGFGRGLHCGA